jgi:choice-of-anchor C domain-containing protein
MKSIIKGILGVTALVVVTTSVSADLVANGDFGIPSVTSDPGYQTVSAGSSTITGWTVGGAGVDVIASTLWQAPSGMSQSVDLNALGSGSVSQSIDVYAGTQYTIAFYLSGNPGADPGVKTVDVTFGGMSTPLHYSYNTLLNNNTATDMKWQLQTFDYTPTVSGSYPLIFESKTGGAAGPAIGGVSVVPEPQTYAVFAGLALIGFVSYRRFRTMSAKA